MPRKPEPLKPWMFEAIQLMVRQGLGLKQAAEQLGENITPQEAERISARALFQEALEEARLSFYTEIGSNPKLTREAVIGRLYQLAENLASEGENYKAADTYLKLAKTAGFCGQETDTPFKVLTSLNQSELDAIKARLKEQTEKSQVTAPGAAIPPEAESERVN